MRTWWLALLLVLVVVAAFWPALWNEFNYDDVTNIEGNLNYRGLSWANLKWMFTTFEAGHYQPLSWLTLGLDYVLWGMRPFGYHLTNLLLHVGSTVLVYLIALRLIKAAWRESPVVARQEPRPPIHVHVGAALAALLFGVHPLRVESVAWVTERRDVLSSFFLLGSVLAYLTAQQTGDAHRRKWLSVTLAAFVLSVLSRAMGVTLPVVLLFLDWYPLRRWGRWREQGTGNRDQGSGVRDQASGVIGFRFLLEKIPFIIVALAAGILAPLAQHSVGATIPLAQHGIPARMAQAVYGLVFYLQKTIMPTGLIPIYELHLPLNPIAPRYVVSAALVVLIVWGLFRLRRRWPALTVAGLCYAILVFPVLGFVQSGQQEVADRYSYLASIGWAIVAGGLLACWGSNRRGAEGAEAKFILCGLGTSAVVAILGALTWRQCLVWRTPETLWTHTVRYDSNCATAEYNLGTVLARRGDPAAALPYLQKAVTINGGYVDAFYNLGNALTELKRPAEAVPAYKATVRLKPQYPQAHFHLANALAAIGANDEAVEHYRLAVQHKPDYFEARYCLALQLGDHARPADALSEYRAALRLKPEHPELHYDYGRALVTAGQIEAGMNEYREALRLRPVFAEAHINLGVALVALGRREEALTEYRRALEIMPDSAEAHYNLASIWQSQGKSQEAAQEFREALRLKPNYVEAHVNLAVSLVGEARYDEAIAEYREALRINPAHVIARINLGNALARTGRTGEAIPIFHEALRLDPNHPDAHFNLGVALGMQGQMDEAVAEFRRVLELRPNDNAARLQLGQALAAQGKLQDAAAQYQAILQSEPNHAEARTRLNALQAQTEK
ncbi:MAG TPA: tetratricopeptide repeat protein [Phycisphaerae bacterium]